jgi:hypothetical protein
MRTDGKIDGHANIKTLTHDSQIFATFLSEYLKKKVIYHVFLYFVILQHLFVKVILNIIVIVLCTKCHIVALIQNSSGHRSLCAFYVRAICVSDSEICSDKKFANTIILLNLNWT